MDQGNKRALIIGINEYDNQGFDKLDCAINDANAINRVLSKEDVEGFKWDVILLNNNPTKPELERSLAALLNRTQENDLVLIYFAGHGKLDKSGKLCLATRDTDVNMLRATSVPIDNIVGMLEETRCKHAVFIIDSCYSGAAGVSYRGGAPIPTGYFEQYASGGKGRVIISASKAFGGAREDKSKGHGIFTHYLVEGLEKGEADKGEAPYVYITDVFDYARKKVESETNNLQIPDSWPKEGVEVIPIATSAKYKHRMESEGLTNEARDLINQRKLDEAWDALNKAHDLFGQRSNALEEIQPLLERMKEDLVDYDLHHKDKRIPTPILDRSLEILCKPFLKMTGIEKEYIRAVARLLSANGLSLVNFEILWNRLGKFEEGFKPCPESDQRQMREGATVSTADQDPVKAKDSGSRPAKEAEKKDERASSDGQKTESSREPQPNKVLRDQVFICYEGQDVEWLEKLKATLKPYLDKHRICSWDNTLIKPGSRRIVEIDKALASAKAAVLLVSTAFLQSDTITKHELPYLLKAAENNELTIFWIAVRPSAYQQTPLADFQPVNDASKPLSSLSPAEQDNEFVKVCEKIMEELLRTKS